MPPPRKCIFGLAVSNPDLWTPLTLKTFLALPTHMMNICAEFHWNPSTTSRHIAERDVYMYHPSHFLCVFSIATWLSLQPWSCLDYNVVMTFRFNDNNNNNTCTLTDGRMTEKDNAFSVYYWRRRHVMLLCFSHFYFIFHFFLFFKGQWLVLWTHCPVHNCLLTNVALYLLIAANKDWLIDL